MIEKSKGGKNGLAQFDPGGKTGLVQFDPGVRMRGGSNWTATPAKKGRVAHLKAEVNS